MAYPQSMDWDRVGHQAQHAIERALERMQQNVDRMAEKAARRQERLQHMADREARLQEKLERKARRAAEYARRSGSTVETEDWEAQAEAGPVEPPPSLDEERLSILKMVEQGQITPAEAEMLLDALE